MNGFLMLIIRYDCFDRDGRLDDAAMSSYSQSLFSLIKQLMNSSPSERPSAAMVVQACLNKAMEETDKNTQASNKSVPAAQATSKPLSVYMSTPSSAMPSPSSNTLLVLLDEVERLKKQLKDSRQEINKLSKSNGYNS
jgi:hypothetical protein